MLVAPRLSWPILFGENHLHCTQALVDYGEPSILFRHPSMSFKIACSLESPIRGGLHQRDNTHAGVTCLLTGAPSPGIPFTSSKLNRGLNFVSVCLTFGSSLMAASPSDFWVDGQEIRLVLKFKVIFFTCLPSQISTDLLPLAMHHSVLFLQIHWNLLLLKILSRI